jgi:hypothetical protein
MTQDDALRQACEVVAIELIELPLRVDAVEQYTQRLLAFAKAQRSVVYLELASLYRGEGGDLAAVVRYCEQRAKELES